MAKVVTTHYEDDLDGTRLGDDELDTVDFTYRGTSYTLELGPNNAARFDADMAKYIEAAIRAQQRGQARDVGPAQGAPVAKARRTGRTEPVGGTSSRTAGRRQVAGRKSVEQLTANQRKAIRAWANSNGHNTSSRGRLPAEVIAAFNAAHA
ncbi:MAG: Lsr2 family protein [Actinobacteria bacterium]|nr:Lsr2 family protein [Actinomycetota bacterium]